MASADDVATYILEKQGAMSTWKLQKLVYYCQAWHKVWDEDDLFADRIEAWANGPVTPSLYQRHKGFFTVRSWRFGDVANLAKPERGTIDAVLSFYGDKAAHWLSELTHLEDPWRNARQGLAPGERGSNEITTEAMGAYYGSL